MSNISALTIATKQFNRYTPIPIFILGLVGNIFNILIFTRRSLFKNPCTVYFLSATCVNINILFFGLLVRSLMDGFNIDVISNILVFCRLRYIVFHPSSVLSSWFLVLASIDRFCISSQSIRLRKFSHLAIARRAVIVASCVCLLMYIHIFGLFEIEQLQSGPYCYAKRGFYRVFYDFLFFASFSFFPPILMMIFGLATVRNILLTRTRVGITRPTILGQLNKKDRQLIWMLLVQLIATIVCTLPYTILKLYSTFTVNDTKNLYRSEIELLVLQITRQLLYIGAGMNFYL